MPNFSLIGVCVCMLWQILQSVQKDEAEEEEKNEEKPETLAICTLEMAEVIFFNFHM